VCVCARVFLCLCECEYTCVNVSESVCIYVCECLGEAWMFGWVGLRGVLGVQCKMII
jgi:hypothetical protein